MSVATKPTPKIRTKVVFTDVLAHSSKQESLVARYPRVGFVQVNGMTKPIYVGHPNSRCDVCERAFGKHPVSQSVEGAVVLCGDDLMTFTDVKAP